MDHALEVWQSVNYASERFPIRDIDGHGLETWVGFFRCVAAQHDHAAGAVILEPAGQRAADVAGPAGDQVARVGADRGRGRQLQDQLADGAALAQRTQRLLGQHQRQDRAPRRRELAVAQQGEELCPYDR